MEILNQHQKTVQSELANLREEDAKKWVAAATSSMIEEIRSGTTTWSPAMVEAFEREIRRNQTLATGKIDEEESF